MNLQQPDDRQGAKSRQAIRLEDKKERTTSSSYGEDFFSLKKKRRNGRGAVRRFKTSHRHRRWSDGDIIICARHRSLL